MRGSAQKESCMHQIAHAIINIALLALIPAALHSGYAKADEETRGSPHRDATKATVAPTLDVKIAVGAVGDADLMQGVYIFHLKCSGSCDLDRIALNQCSKSGYGKATFAPRVDKWSTTTNSMTAKQISGNQVLLTVFQAFEHGLPAQMTITFNSSGEPFTRVVGLRASGFLDFGVFPELKPIEYAPVPSDRVKALDCPALLPGLNPSGP